jgi:acyl-CoA thioesterase FadM
MDFRFKGPVYVGETVTCTLEITEIDDNSRAKATATIVKEDGGTVIEAEIGGIVPGDRERRVLREMLSEGDPTNGRTGVHPKTAVF